ncbi:hypothetical protein Ga0609869_000541 [Rhodovulum iodosum]|uniref:DUF3306 domain-containing protein n=1 Tax=Rhodovulum iodosum TaxID=68291 RepID=A0ABV3XPE4_9RHOB|nr:DUF3306 domain-containing protein [Rhodovulum robiginosum]RSK31514.1 DUF3306 domain-containing protein [Rhodovulum robiginosum]
MSPAPDGFLARWSRAKRSGGEEPETEGAGPPAEATVPAPAEERSDAEILQELGLSDPDSLQPGDDFSAFLREAVPEHLRRRALRRLWRSNPVLANLDGLNDYDTDFTGDSVGPGLLQTAYKVGRGFVLDEDVPAETPPVERADTAEVETPESDVQIDEVFENSAEPWTEDSVMQDSDRVRARKRMRFRFQTSAEAAAVTEDFLDNE